MRAAAGGFCGGVERRRPGFGLGLEPSARATGRATLGPARAVADEKSRAPRPAGAAAGRPGQ